jgi:signal transduction histidine kinase
VVAAEKTTRGERPRADDVRSESLLQSVLDALPMPAFITDASGRITHANGAVDDFWGTGSETRERLESWAGRYLHGEALNPEEITVDTKRRVQRTILNYARTFEENGRVAGLVVIHIDISERKRTEETERILAEASRILSSSFDYEDTLRQVATLVVSGFAELCAVYLTDASGMRHLGTARRDPPGSWLEEPDRGLTGTLGDAAIGDVSRSGKPLFAGDNLMIVPMWARDTSLGAIALTRAASPFDEHDLSLAERLADRAAIAIDNARIYHDAHQRAIAEVALRKAAAAVSAAYTIQDVIAQVADRALEAIRADGAFVERIDLAQDEIELVAAAGFWRPKTGTRLPYQGSLAQSVIERASPILLDHGERTDSALLRQMRDVCGPCAILVVPLRDAGEPIGCLILVRRSNAEIFTPDEVNRAQAFGELASLAFRKIHLLEESEHRREDVERVTESRNRLVRGFSHDLKNPIGAADGYVALLAEHMSEGLTEQQLDFLARVRRQLRSAIELIEDLGELHMAEAGQLPLHLTAVELIDLVSEVADSYRPLSELKGLTLNVEYPEQVPVISTDAGRARQIVGNLLSNAVKYTSEGRIDVCIGVVAGERAGADPQWITIEVADTGPGIPEDKVHLIFQEFSRVSPQSARGSGLGLAISQRIAEALGGHVAVESREGVGSVFTLWLPYKRAGAAPEPREPHL